METKSKQSRYKNRPTNWLCRAPVGERGSQTSQGPAAQPPPTGSAQGQGPAPLSWARPGRISPPTLGLDHKPKLYRQEYSEAP